MAEGSSSRGIVVERRRARRHPAARIPTVRAGIVAGPEVALIDVSPHGLLVESDIKLTPGAAICLTIRINDETHLVGGRVAHVDAVVSGSEPKYRAGIALDEAFPYFDIPAHERTTTPAASVPTAAAPPHEGDANARESELAQELAAQARETAALREALKEQQREQQQSTRMIGWLRDALQTYERSRQNAQEAYKYEREEWDRQRRALEEAAESARRHEQESNEKALAADVQQRALAERLEQQRAMWAAERHALQEELDAATALPEDTARELESLRKAREVLERTLEEERAMIAELLQEKDRLLAELERARIQFDGLKADAEGHRERSEAEKRQLEHRLEVTDAWCADQQELIYQLAKQTLQSAALIQRRSAERPRPPSAGAPAVAMPTAAAGADGVPAAARADATPAAITPQGSADVEPSA